MDADLQDDPREIPGLLEKLSEGYGMVSGWKSHRKDPLSKRLPSKVFNWVTGRLSGLPLHDFNCGLKAYTAECAKELAEQCYGELHRFLPVLAFSKGFRVAEVAVNHYPRLHGSSKFGIERYLRGMLDLFTALFLSRYTKRPMHLFGGLGAALVAPGALALGWLVLQKVLFGGALEGRPLLILASLLCITGLQLVLTGLIAEMLVKHRGGDVPHSILPGSSGISLERYPSSSELAVTLLAFPAGSTEQART
jgi:hypothetical protein